MSKESIGEAPPAKSRIRVVEILVVIAIIAVLAALLIPPVQWVSDGSRELPVRVFVFDRQTGEAIAGAKVAIFRSARLDSPEVAKSQAANFGDLDTWIDSGMGQDPEDRDNHADTDSEGFVVIPFKFSTSASHRNPQLRAFPAKCWIYVRSSTHGAVLTTPGSNPVVVSEVMERGGFFVPIGLARLSSPP